MPKITYPRPCPKCGKICSRTSFWRHKKQCGTTKNRYQCPHCHLSFAQSGDRQLHITQQHSMNPRRFTCPKCDQEFSRKQNMQLHLATVCAEVKPSYLCVFCGARFTRDTNRQTHMRRVHALGYDEEDVNLLLHLQQLSEESDCKNEWQFVESRPIEKGEPKICPCGQTTIQNYYFLENKINGNRTFVGSTCIENVDHEAGKVIGYFEYILEHPVKGTFIESVRDELQKFAVRSNTVLVKGAANTVQHLNPPVTLTKEGKGEVIVKYSKPATLEQGKDYKLKLKAKYVKGQLTFIAV